MDNASNEERQLLLDKILVEIKKKGLTAYDINKHTGISTNGIQKIIDGETKLPGLKTLKKIENYLQLGRLQNFKKKMRDYQMFGSEHGAPYFENTNASAGLSFLTDNAGESPESYIKVPGLNVDAYINVFGDSMYPKYKSGQIIGIKLVEKEMVHFGYAYIVEMVDGESYIKYIQPGKNEDHWSLENENQHFKSKQFHLSKIRRVFKIKSILTRESL